MPPHAAKLNKNTVTAALTCAAGVEVSAMSFGHCNLVRQSRLTARSCRLTALTHLRSLVLATSSCAVLSECSSRVIGRRNYLIQAMVSFRG